MPIAKEGAARSVEQEHVAVVEVVMGKVIFAAHVV